MVIIMGVDERSVGALFLQRHGRRHGVSRSILGDHVIVIVLFIDLHVGLLPAVTVDLEARSASKTSAMQKDNGRGTAPFISGSNSSKSARRSDVSGTNSLCWQ